MGTGSQWEDVDLMGGGEGRGERNGEGEEGGMNEVEGYSE